MSLGRNYSSVNRGFNPQWKTELCRPFTYSGLCSWGERCRYAHGMEQLRGGLEELRWGAGRGAGEGVEDFLRRIRSQEEEKEVGGEDTVVEEVVKLNT